MKKNSMEKSSKNTSLITLIIILMLVIGVFVFAFRMTVSKFESYRDGKLSLARETVKVKSNTTLEKLLRETKEEREEVSKLFLDEIGLVEFFDQIKDVGEELSIEVDLVTLQKNKEGDLSLQYQASGSYKDLYSFIIMMENLPYYSGVRSLSLTGGKSAVESESFWSLSTSISISSFIGKLEEGRQNFK